MLVAKNQGICGPEWSSFEVKEAPDTTPGLKFTIAPRTRKANVILTPASVREFAERLLEWADQHESRPSSVSGTLVED